jgi:hypothetical protein
MGVETRGKVRVFPSHPFGGRLHRQFRMIVVWQDSRAIHPGQRRLVQLVTARKPIPGSIMDCQEEAVDRWSPRTCRPRNRKKINIRFRKT